MKKDGIMSQSSKKYGTFIAIALALLIAKAFWVAIEFYLPKSGVEKSNAKEVKPLYYRYSLASKKDKPKAVVQKQINKPKKVVTKPLEIKSFILSGVYVSKDLKLASIVYKNKKEVLAIGEELAGFKLKDVGLDYALFTKDGKDYKIDLYKNKKNQTKQKSNTNQPTQTKQKEEKKDKVYKDGDVTVIPKSLLNHYKTNITEIQKNVGMLPYYKDKKLQGFRVNYIKQNSEFSKLGLKIGDIIIAINGEEINSFDVPMRYFKNIDSLNAITLTVKRGNKTEEIEYETR